MGLYNRFGRLILSMPLLQPHLQRLRRLGSLVTIQDRAGGWPASTIRPSMRRLRRTMQSEVHIGGLADT